MYRPISSPGRHDTKRVGQKLIDPEAFWQLIKAVRRFGMSETIAVLGIKDV